jgi:hypothetical protein
MIGCAVDPHRLLDPMAFRGGHPNGINMEMTMNIASCHFKLNQAGYFYVQMLSEMQINDLTFRYNLSAFLGSARSAIQYIYEASVSTGRLDWYKSHITAYSSFAFFKSERDADIHRVPTDPGYVISMAVTGEFVDNLKNAGAKFREVELKLRDHGTHYFLGANETDEVAERCETYLRELALFVEEATRARILAPA